VVGGGPAGLVAAIAAARGGARVTLLERMLRVGRKLLATGNGRCNWSNLDLHPRHFHGAAPEFVRAVLERFDGAATRAFFEDLGVVAAADERGRVFPRSQQASAVLDVLRAEAARLGVAEVVDADARELERAGAGWRLWTEDNRDFRADAVVLACGGRAAPHLGGIGGGYRLATGLGHRLVEPFPALVQLKLEAPSQKHLAGVSFDGRVALLVDGQEVARAAGEVLFVEFGLSGPPVLDLSRQAGAALRAGRRVELELAVVPELDRAALEAFLGARFARLAGRPLASALTGFLNKKLAQVLLGLAGLGPSAGPEAPGVARDAGSVTAEERARLAALCTGWRLPVTGSGAWQGAQVTAGGVDTREVDPATLQSRLVPGLFFAGEVLDVDGDCGGYNLQWAWSSGWVAGGSAARHA
jgi:predicted Rossmann fold flavoprotein